MTAHRFQVFCIAVVLCVAQTALGQSWDRANKWWIVQDAKTGGLAALKAKWEGGGSDFIAGRWGVGYATYGTFDGTWDKPVSITSPKKDQSLVVYELPSLRLEVSRFLNADDRLEETYTFTNVGSEPLTFKPGSVGIAMPLRDQYGRPAAKFLDGAFNTHVWAGGSTSYIQAVRMGAKPPHLGVLVTAGGISAYSTRGAAKNIRGTFYVHPDMMTLAPGEHYTLGWSVFQYADTTDFWTQAKLVHPHLVRLEAERYTVIQGTPLRITATGDTSDLADAQLKINGKPQPIAADGGTVRATIATQTLGEQLVELRYRGGQRTFLRALVIPNPEDLIRARVEFIVAHQQVRDASSPADGAYVPYDNVDNAIAYDESLRFGNHNAGRERVGMGVLVALQAARTGDAALKARLLASLERYDAFVSRELQDERGAVFSAVGRKDGNRLYNYPWVAHFHLAMHKATGEPRHLQRYVDTVHAFYANGGKTFYCIGMPIMDGVTSLAKAGLNAEADELTGLFRAHADEILRNGTNYPPHEVDYEQSIVGPAVQTLLEAYGLTHDERYLAGVRTQLPVLEAFNGSQPDYHLHEIAIRYWDDYWFGNPGIYGDTFPHYWSTITGVVFDLHARLVDAPAYAARADAILLGNMALFTPEGRASCAYVYPLTVDRQPGAFFDRLANDQDWAMVNYLVVTDGRGKH